MDDLKKGTCKDFTAWDLNCPRYVKPDNKLRKKFVRKYRRNSKLALDKQLDILLEEAIDIKILIALG